MIPLQDVTRELFAPMRKHESDAEPARARLDVSNDTYSQSRFFLPVQKNTSTCFFRYVKHTTCIQRVFYSAHANDVAKNPTRMHHTWINELIHTVRQIDWKSFSVLRQRSLCDSIQTSPAFDALTAVLESYSSILYWMHTNHYVVHATVQWFMLCMEHDVTRSVLERTLVTSSSSSPLQIQQTKNHTFHVVHTLLPCEIDMPTSASCYADSNELHVGTLEPLTYGWTSHPQHVICIQPLDIVAYSREVHNTKPSHTCLMFQPQCMKKNVFTCTIKQVCEQLPNIIIDLFMHVNVAHKLLFGVRKHASSSFPQNFEVLMEHMQPLYTFTNTKRPMYIRWGSHAVQNLSTGQTPMMIQNNSVCGLRWTFDDVRRQVDLHAVPFHVCTIVHLYQSLFEPAAQKALQLYHTAPETTLDYWSVWSMFSRYVNDCEKDAFAAMQTTFERIQDKIEEIKNHIYHHVVASRSYSSRTASTTVVDTCTQTQTK